MKVMVTGGAGFIGSHIAERLVREGHHVVVYDNLSTGNVENLRGFEKDVEFVEADVRDLPQLDYRMAGCDWVFHEAAVVSVPYSVEHPQETHDVNLQGTLNVVMAARRQKVKRVVFACSAAVYGEEPELPKTESMRLFPVSPYGVEKMSGEAYLSAWTKLYGVETVSLRYFNVFGPRQDPKSPYSGVISVFVDRALRGVRPTVFGDGLQSRDFVYVSDVVEANLRAATVPEASGRVYNVGTGKPTTLLELLAVLGRLTGRDLSPEHAPARAGDIQDSLADVSRAARELGYAPTVSVEEGLRRLLTYERR